MRVLKKKWNLTCCLGNILMKKRNFTNDDWQGNHLKDSLVVVVATKCYWQEVIKTTQFSLEFSFFFGKVDSFLSPIGLSMHVGDPFFTNTACVHTYPAYFPAVSGNFWKRSPEWKFFYPIRIRIRVDGRIRKFANTLTSFSWIQSSRRAL